MIILNLLPPDKKIALISEQNVVQLKKVLLIIVVGVALGVGATAGGRWYLNYELQRLTKELTSAQQTARSSGQDLTGLVDSINGEAKSLQKIQREHTRWSAIITNTLRTTSDSIQVTALAYDIDQKTFKLEGVAKTRNDLLRVKDELEKLDWLENIESPISNLIKKQDIPFTLSGQLTLDSGGSQ